jgi:hypothetical protein
MKDLWGSFYLFTKQFRVHLESVQAKNDEAARRKRLEGRQNRSQAVLGVDMDKEVYIQSLLVSVFLCLALRPSPTPLYLSLPFPSSGFFSSSSFYPHPSALDTYVFSLVQLTNWWLRSEKVS